MTEEDRGRFDTGVIGTENSFSNMAEERINQPTTISLEQGTQKPQSIERWKTWKKQNKTKNEKNKHNKKKQKKTNGMIY